MDITLKTKHFSGSLIAPASKSHSIRALLIATFSRSVCRVFNLSDCADVLSCMNVCKELGALIYKESEFLTVIDSTGIKTEGEVFLDVGDSGTTLYFATALVSTLGVKAVFTGSESLRGRSAGPLIKSLRDLGVSVSTDNFIPYTVDGLLKGGETEIECLTSQYLSALLLACPLAKENSIIKIKSLNEKPYVLMTLYWLDKQGIRYNFNSEQGTFLIYGGQTYKSFTESVYGDFSSASFMFVASAISGGTVTVSGLNLNDKQGDKRVLEVLQRMGCIVTIKADNDFCDKGLKSDVENLAIPFSDSAQRMNSYFNEGEISSCLYSNRSTQAITVVGPVSLKAVNVDMNSIPDALPILAVAACFADSDVKLFNIPQARIKETDRLSVVSNNLNVLGADITELEDGLLIHPVTSLRGGRVNSFFDHRIAMAMIVASLRSENPITVVNAEVCSISYKNFINTFEKLTMNGIDKE